MNTLLAAKKLSKERNTARVDQGNVSLVAEDDIDASRSNEMKFNQEVQKEEPRNTPLARFEETKGGENEENLQKEACVENS